MRQADMHAPITTRQKRQQKWREWGIFRRAKQSRRPDNTLWPWFPCRAVVHSPLYLEFAVNMSRGGYSSTSYAYVSLVTGSTALEGVVDQQ